jgi:hypothetical protein
MKNSTPGKIKNQTYTTACSQDNNKGKRAKKSPQLHACIYNALCFYHFAKKLICFSYCFFIRVALSFLP